MSIVILVLAVAALVLAIFSATGKPWLWIAVVLLAILAIIHGASAYAEETTTTLAVAIPADSTIKLVAESWWGEHGSIIILGGLGVLLTLLLGVIALGAKAVGKVLKMGDEWMEDNLVYRRKEKALAAVDIGFAIKNKEADKIRATTLDGSLPVEDQIRLNREAKAIAGQILHNDPDPQLNLSVLQPVEVDGRIAQQALANRNAIGPATPPANGNGLQNGGGGLINGTKLIALFFLFALCVSCSTYDVTYNETPDGTMNMNIKESVPPGGKRLSDGQALAEVQENGAWRLALGSSTNVDATGTADLIDKLAGRLVELSTMLGQLQAANAALRTAAPAIAIPE